MSKVVGGGHGRAMPSARGGGGKVRPTSVFLQEDEPEPALEASEMWFGGSSRKRKYEIALEKGIIVEEPEPLPWKQRGNGRFQNPSRQEKGGGRKGQPRGHAKKEPEAPAGPPGVVNGEIRSVKWISITADQGLFPADWPELAPVVYQDADIASLLSSSTWIMNDLEIEKEGIEFVHDNDWSEFPAIAEAIKEVGGEESSICVAKYPMLNIWAVGAASKWTKREQAAKLALCIAVAGNVPDFNELAEKQPEFTAFCEGVGIDTDGAAAKANARVPKAANGGEAQWEEPNAEEAENLKNMSDRPFWIDLSASSESVPTELMGMPTRGLALRTDLKARKSLYNRADAALEALLGADGVEELVYHDDPSWEMFPGIGAILKDMFHTEECITVAVSQSLQCWAVGIGNRSKNRHSASKAALAAMVRFNHEDVELDLEQFPVLAEVVDEARAAEEPQAEFV